MNSCKNEKEGMDLCPKCKGGGEIVVEEIKISELCPYCFGDGNFTWLEKVLGKQDKLSARNHVRQQHNLQHLQCLLVNYGLKLGIEVKIEYTMSSPNYSQSISLFGGKGYHDK